MAVYQRGGVYWIDFYFAGKRYRRPGGESHRQAKDALDRIRGRIASGDFDPAELDPVDPEPGPLFERVLKLYRENRDAAGKLTESYHHLSRWCEAFKGRPVASITSEEIEVKLTTWAEARKWAPATRNRALGQLSGMLSYAYGRRWLDSHPTERGRVPLLREDNAREGWLRPEVIETLKAKAREIGKAWIVPHITAAAETGMRLGELCSLTRASYREDGEVGPHVLTGRTKNGTVLACPVAGETLAYIRGVVEKLPFPGSYLFPGPMGKGAHEAIRRTFRKIVTAAELSYGRTREGITWHSLRHSMATNARLAGVPEEVIQRMGNWKDRRMVNRYAKVPSELMRDGATKLAVFMAHSHTTVTNAPAAGQATADAAR
jgi:integrase